MPASTRCLTALLILTACGSPTAPGGYTAPAPDQSRDPAALREPTVLYLCGRWSSGTPPADSNILVDVAFSRTSLDGPWDRPTSADRALVRSHGAQIVYQFHSPAVRVWIPTREVPRLSSRVRIMLAVADPRRYDWHVVVYFKPSHQYTPSDEAMFAQLGGRITHRYPTFNGFAGLLPDASIPKLRSDPNVAQADGAPPFALCS
jgi:hypothetical protein